MSLRPRLVASTVGGVGLLTDPAARARGVLVCFTDRNGGVSTPPFDTLNLAARGGDDPADVDVNRTRAADACGFDPVALALARQVHEVALIEAVPGGAGVLGEADVLVARDPGPTVGMLTADCGPAVIAGESGVAVVHAGWRGLVRDVVRAGVEAVAPVWAAWVGPCIRSCCYEVGPDVIDAFRSAGLPVADDAHVDIADATVDALHAAGVDEVAAAGVCTHCNPAFFSYRRDGLTGRQGAFAGLLRI
jgi:hypothetical protein